MAAASKGRAAACFWKGGLLNVIQNRSVKKPLFVKCTEEDPSLKFKFFAISVLKNQFQIQNTVLLLVCVQIQIDFYALTLQKDDF